MQAKVDPHWSPELIQLTGLQQCHFVNMEHKIMEAFCAAVPKKSSAKVAAESPLTPSGQTVASASLEKMGRKVLTSNHGVAGELQSHRSRRNTGRSAGSQDYTARNPKQNIASQSPSKKFKDGVIGFATTTKNLSSRFQTDVKRTGDRKKENSVPDNHNRQKNQTIASEFDSHENLRGAGATAATG